MKLNPNKTLIEVIGKGAFRSIYFRDSYAGINEKWQKNSWKELNQLKNINKKYYSSDYYDLSVIKYGVKCGTSLRFWENKGWVNETDPYGWFQCHFRYWLGARSKDDEEQINRWKKIVTRFRGKLVKQTRDAGSEFDDHSIHLNLDRFYCIGVRN